MEPTAHVGWIDRNLAILAEIDLRLGLRSFLVCSRVGSVVRKVVLEEPPGNRALDDDLVKSARSRLFGVAIDAL
jgi:hypothetical protein